MFNIQRARVRAVSRALGQLQVADLYSVSPRELRALRRQLLAWSNTAGSEGRDQAAWPTVRSHLVALRAGTLAA